MHNPFVVILLAALASWLFGAAWYTSLGTAWQRANAMPPCPPEERKMPVVPLAVCFVGELVMAAVAYQTLDHLGVAGAGFGAIAGLTLGIGFMATSTIINHQFLQKPWTATAIDGLHWVLVVVIQGAVIGALA
jgi:hypothetical protein